MGGQRHSKNAGTMGVEGLTYHEKKALGFGTVQQRLGKVKLVFATLLLAYTDLLVQSRVVANSFTPLQLIHTYSRCAVGLCGQLL